MHPGTLHVFWTMRHETYASGRSTVSVRSAAPASLLHACCMTGPWQRSPGSTTATLAAISISRSSAFAPGSRNACGNGQQPAFRAAWHYRYVVLGRPPNCGLHLGSVSRTDKPQ
jgi:hypothetical protein